MRLLRAWYALVTPGAYRLTEAGGGITRRTTRIASQARVRRSAVRSSAPQYPPPARRRAVTGPCPSGQAPGRLHQEAP
ncbi:hypothetical protein OG978_04015 [Streptomyces sp. NBC_01591]|uniref:hypothetical protein n=1 Tax=Streptomyces sp. NBC_01591 TaxID=2975888 RepID=UPI002DDB5E29|nr:hypothetical protein [Streptomyces sp. NBC_01591]WSD66616.1 hypothetical protein OG978_04015 [Streptomyces sp. NBC_01591]